MPGYTACECRASNETCITPYGEHIGRKQRECTHLQKVETKVTVLMLQELYRTVF
jgi:hypothetical protein